MFLLLKILPSSEYRNIVDSIKNFIEIGNAFDFASVSPR